MSIENTLQSIATSLRDISVSLAAIANAKPVEAAKPAPAPEVPAAPVVSAPAPVAPVAVPVVEAPVVPAVTPAPAVAAAPFSDHAGLMAYTMEKYRTLGPIKGGMIQTTLLELGCTNINTLPAEKYGEFYAKVEAL